jgi:hypothetical protein
MAEHRRMTAGRRKAPGSPAAPEKAPSPRPVAPPVPVRPLISKYGFSNGFNASSDPIIADIVTRDIDRLCRGLWA